MKRQIACVLPLLLLVFAAAQAKSLQTKGPEDVVKFQEKSGELQGTVNVFEPEAGLLIVERNSVTYSFVVTPATKIVIGNQKGKTEDLVGSKGKSITIKYRAERKGNKATEIVLP